MYMKLLNLLRTKILLTSTLLIVLTISPALGMNPILQKYCQAELHSKQSSILTTQSATEQEEELNCLQGARDLEAQERRIVSDPQIQRNRLIQNDDSLGDDIRNCCTNERCLIRTLSYLSNPTYVFLAFVVSICGAKALGLVP
jgi:hypothetical protein